jgi:hypothetical protein
MKKTLSSCFACEGRGGLMFMFKDGAHSVPCHVCEGRGCIGDGFMKRPIKYEKRLNHYKISASIMKGAKP